MNKSWDVVGPQKIPISEIEESKMRSKAMFIIVWKRVIKRFISYLNRNK